MTIELELDSSPTAMTQSPAHKKRRTGMKSDDVIPKTSDITAQDDPELALEYTTLDPSWLEILRPFLHTPAFLTLKSHLNECIRRGGIGVYPPPEQWYAWSRLTPLNRVKVVILGQDPYHGPGQAHGLAFSVPPSLVKLPPSLGNIYKELSRDPDVEWKFPDGRKGPGHGCLIGWAEQGVLLLNTTLTVLPGRAGSHAKLGWSHFTDFIISYLANNQSNLVFMLWGQHAQQKKSLIESDGKTDNHLVLECAHPSPLSARRGFEGCGHFSRANAYLKQHEKSQIQWDDLPIRETVNDD